MKFDIKNRFTNDVVFSCKLTPELADAGYAEQLCFAVNKAIAAKADLSGADLSGAKDFATAIAKTRILAEGSIIGWKKLQNGVIAKLRIPEEAKRSHAFGRKCRAEYVDVLEVIGAKVGVSKYSQTTKYVAGKRVTPDAFDTNWQIECASGIHFFITREEAEAYE
jgi:hypothetical protein